jgi:hypothetical protein
MMRRASRWAVAVAAAAVPIASVGPSRAQSAAAPDRDRPAKPAQEQRPRRESGAAHWAGPSSQLVWTDARAGIEAVQLSTFFADFNQVSAGFLPTSGVGPSLGVGAGLRFRFLTLGARGRVASFDDPATVGPWQIWTLDAELGVRVPLGSLEPHLTFSGGYASFGGFHNAISGLGEGLDVHGADFALGVGLDYWITHTVSIGADVQGQMLAIARPGISVRDLATPKEVGTLNDAKARILQANGTSVGTALSATAVLGVHF